MAFFLPFVFAAVGASALGSVGMSIAGGIKKDQYAEEGIKHQKQTTWCNAVMDAISSTSTAPKAIAQFRQ